MSALPLDRITLRGMRFHTLIGILPHEREHAQPIEIDVTVAVRQGSAVVDYRKLYAEVREATDAPKLSYLEDLANTIASRILKATPVDRVRVAIRKPHAAVGGPLEYAEVAIERTRDA
jgi:7,8-dihydroneopterin aldolase/epimerase/oxygenase